jgi:hypothetical protein
MYFISNDIVDERLVNNLSRQFYCTENYTWNIEIFFIYICINISNILQIVNLHCTTQDNTNVK